MQQNELQTNVVLQQCIVLSSAHNQKELQLIIVLLQIMPSFGGFIGIVMALFVIFVIGPPIGTLATNRYDVTGQGIAITFVLANIAGLLITCPAVSRYTRKLSSKGRAVKALKRMNLLGLVRNILKNPCMSLNCFLPRGQSAVVTPSSGLGIVCVSTLSWQHPCTNWLVTMVQVPA